VKDADEVVRKLTEAGYTVGRPAVRKEDGVLLYRVNNVFMFWLDAVDLAEGSTTVSEVIRQCARRVADTSLPFRVMLALPL
jgi:hypothetical protein